MKVNANRIEIMHACVKKYVLVCVREEETTWEKNV